jgi:signal transduction histidine kinase
MSAEHDVATIIVFGDLSLPTVPEGVRVVAVQEQGALIEAAAECVWPVIVTAAAQLEALSSLPKALVVAGCQTPEEGVLAAAVVALPLWDASASDLALRSALGVRDRLQGLEREVEATAADHDAFVHAVSHDLKGPLQGIIGLAGLLMEQSGVRVFPEVGAYAGRIEGEADRLASMVSALTAYARLGRPRPTVTTVALGALIDTLSASAIRRHTGRFPRFQVAPGIGDVYANEQLLTVAIDALIDNAVSFTEPGPVQISVGWTVGSEGRALLTFTDAGIGIPEHATEVVFEMFTRLDKRRTDGIGVGLTMARRAVELCGGTLHLTSTPGEGTTAHLGFMLAD